MAPPSLLSSFGLWWSRTVHPVLGGRPNPHLLSTRLRGSERAGGSSVWERRGRMEAGKRGRGWSTSPAPSRFSQSPEPVLVEVSTEDGADISSEPTTKENQITWHWMFSPAWPLKEQLNMKLGHLLSFWERDDSIDFNITAVFVRFLFYSQEQSKWANFSQNNQPFAKTSRSSF